MQIIINRSLNPKDRAKLDNAVAGVAAAAANDEDIMAALCELGDLFAAQDDTQNDICTALIELADMIVG